MNQTDREALKAFSEQLEEITRGLQALETLGKPSTIEALDKLVRVAPTLVKLADGYTAAGTVGGWFGKLVKWSASLAGLILALAAVWTLTFGDKS